MVAVLVLAVVNEGAGGKSRVGEGEKDSRQGTFMRQGESKEIISS